MGKLTQNIRHFVLEVLSSHERVQKLLSALEHRVDFTTASAQMTIVVEGFPEVVD